MPQFASPKWLVFLWKKALELLTTLIHPSVTAMDGLIVNRYAVRAIVRDGDDILLLYTRRYNDYSLPGWWRR
ncbi:hypothetical protein [Deefgea sp. CFH1-16]|uniref:hypothetical protein n=1 Tax=Deefgea sp. CFH1-16 TaxID=2675457 RepID=UPI0019402388|nr:hypothetical protein [Deefgea sp. CFH1-16]